MKYLLHTFYLLTTLFFITSCGVDRSGEYYALVGDDMWIEEVMKQHYLWYDQIPEISEKDYFAEPEEFLQKLLYSKALVLFMGKRLLKVIGNLYLLSQDRQDSCQ